MELLLTGVIIVLGLVLCGFAWLMGRVTDLERDVLGMRQRFQEGGVDLTDRLATEVIITERWHDHDRDIPPTGQTRLDEWVDAD